MSSGKYGILAEYQRPVEHALIDAGADFIVGHHPHVVHPIERHRNGLIAYSLGNYVFQSWGHFDRPSTEVLPADATTEKPEPALSLDMPLAPFRNPFGAEEMLEAPFEARSSVAGFAATPPRHLTW